MSPSKSQPALLGGLAMGVLSALPVINLANCCCAWVIFGGMLAAYLMQQNHPEPVQAGDGAIVGLLSGLVGAFVWLVISVPINAVMAPFQVGLMRRMMATGGALPPEVRSMFDSMAEGPAIGLGLVFGFFVMLCAGAFFGMLGGLFGALIFKKAPVTPPPPPSGFDPPSFTPPPLPPGN